MNYWLITTEYPPIHGGGISTYAYHTAQMCLQRGVNVSVFIHDYELRVVKEQVVEGVRVIRFNDSQHEIHSTLGPIAALSYLYAEVLKDYIQKEGAPDFIESQDYQGIGYYLQQRKLTLDPLFKDIPIVLTMHAPGFLYLEYNQVPRFKFPDFWTGEMEKSSIRSADVLISPSQYLVDELSPRMCMEDINPIVLSNPFKPIYTPEELAFDFPTEL